MGPEITGTTTLDLPQEAAIAPIQVPQFRPNAGGATASRARAPESGGPAV